VHQPHAEKGAAAVRMLLDPNGDREITFPVELVVRGSTGAPPARSFD
jgi:DNA-binding LacI/PurR family transcriptional regulator